MTTTPTLAEILRLAIANERAGMRTHLPGRVIAYNAETQRADVELQIKQSARSAEGDRVFEVLPDLFDVPVGHPRGGGFVVHFPLAAGDHVWVSFSAYSLGEFMRTGRVSEPRDARTHGLFPYAFPASDPSEPGRLANLPSSALAVASETGPAVVIDGSAVRIGADLAAAAAADDASALASRVDAALQAIDNAFATFIPGSGGASFPAPYVFTDSTASSSLKLDE